MQVCVWCCLLGREGVMVRSGLTGAVLVVSVPGDGGHEVDAGQSGHEALETVSLATVRAIRPVPAHTHEQGLFVRTHKLRIINTSV